MQALADPHALLGAHPADGGVLFRAYRPEATRVRALLDAGGGVHALGRVALVGIHTRGVPLAERLATLIEERSGEEVALGAVERGRRSLARIGAAVAILVPLSSSDGEAIARLFNEGS